jgi:hypothetical protein
MPLRSRSKTPDKPAQGEKNATGEKNGNAWRIGPSVVDILSDIQNRPEQERTCSKILNDLGGWVWE